MRKYMIIMLVRYLSKFKFKLDNHRTAYLMVNVYMDSAVQSITVAITKLVF